MKTSLVEKTALVETVKSNNPTLYTSALGYLKRKFRNRKAEPSILEIFNAIHHVKFAMEKNKRTAQAKLAYELHDHAAEAADWVNAGYDS